jgi:hypothetical protein
MDALSASANACKLASTVSPFTKFEVREMLPYEITNTPLELGRTGAGVARQQLVSTENSRRFSAPSDDLQRRQRVSEPQQHKKKKKTRSFPGYFI